MPDQANRLDENTLERMLSWTRLFRGVGVAIDAKKLILAVLGLLLFEAGREGLDRLFPRPEPMLLHPWPTVVRRRRRGSWNHRDRDSRRTAPVCGPT